MKMSDKQWEAYVMGLVDANHHRAVAAAQPVPVQIAPEFDRPRLSKRVLDVMGAVLWTAVMALAVAACLIYASA